MHKMIWLNKILHKLRTLFRTRSFKMPEWIMFLYIADEFLISYSTPPYLVSVKLFEIGHVIELYLKAAYAKKKRH